MSTSRPANILSLSLALLLAASTASLAGGAPAAARYSEPRAEPVVEKASFRAHGSEYRIVAMKREIPWCERPVVDEHYPGEGECTYFSVREVDYVVLKDGRRLGKPGRFRGQPRCGGEETFLTVARVAARPVGFRLELGGIYGNTYSPLFRYVLVSPRAEGYRDLEILAKTEPTLRLRGGKLEFWFMYEAWLNGVGTCYACCVPARWRLPADFGDAAALDRTLDRVDWENWPIDPGEYRIRFDSLPALYEAGRGSRNPALMRRALRRRYDAGEREMYQETGIAPVKPPEDGDYASWTPGPSRRDIERDIRTHEAAWKRMDGGRPTPASGDPD